MNWKRGFSWAASGLLGVVLLAALTACGSGSGSGSGAGATAGSATAVAANILRVHYHRQDGSYTGWGVYSWAGPTSASPTWPTPNFPFTTADPDGWGEYVDIPMAGAATAISFLVVNPAGGGTKDTPANLSGTFPSLASAGSNLWILSGNPTVYTTEPPANLMPTFGAQAIWLAPDTLVWPGSSAASYTLNLAAKGGISSNATGVTGADSSCPLAITSGLSAALKAQYPQYANCAGLTVPASVDARAALKGQAVVAAFDASGNLLTGTSLQIAPVLDALYAGAAGAKTLGVSFSNDIPTFALWAPTATGVALNLRASANGAATAYPMVLDPASGVWSTTAADSSWTNAAYYDYNVTVFSRAANNAIVTNEVIDPYAVSLNANAQYGMVLNLADAASAPQGWPGALIPTAASASGSVIYELHVRDFSAYSGTGNAGKFLAFTEAGPGMTHLAALANAGLTHVHILPAFATASVDEVNGVNIDPGMPTSTGDGAAAQAYLTTGNAATGVAPQDQDLFNWGYDPVVYGAPEGAYSSSAASGGARVMEFRQMVQALHNLGLRVIMDVVYNHTAFAGQAPLSVLDRVVPGYYYRLDGQGNVANQSCCSDIANENAMMAKLTTDTLVRWADQYKVDGFRFDEMGLLPKAAMQSALAAVTAVTAADGRGHTYFYGEGWETTVPFVSATQANMAGTGIGTFNDRMRDSIRGGGPFDSGAAVVANQGFASGLGYDPTGSNTVAAQTVTALANQDFLEVSLAGNLAAFPLNGATTGAALQYGGQNAGYTAAPAENVAYISCHDNETIWDISQYKQPAATSGADRARAQVVDLSTVLLAHGVAFIQAGDDLLRSKSMDGNSYNSGDYFNRIYWDASGNNWAVGIPPQNTGNNAANLVQEQGVLTNANAAVTGSEILGASQAFQDFLAVRKSSSLFHLPDAASIIAQVRFPDQGLGQIPGVVVMQVGDGSSSVGDNAFASALIVFNATKTAQTVTYPWYAGRSVALHPAQALGSDSTARAAVFSPATGAFTVPARTTAVFVEAANNGFTGNVPALYLTGDMNGWSNGSPMKLVAPHTWQASVQLAAGGSQGFKFYTGTWTAPAPAWGDDGLGDGLASLTGGNCSITAATAGTYVFTFNDSTLAYAVMPPVWFPGVPANLAAATTATSVTLTWGDTGGTIYHVYRSPDGKAAYSLIGSATDGAAGYTDSGLATGTPYFYRVTAGNALFHSGPAAISATPKAGGAGPTSPYAAMFMNGNWNAWATLTGAAKMTLTAEDTWSVTLTGLPAGAFLFKFDTDDNWGNTSGKAWTSTATGLTGTAVVSGGGAANIAMTLPAAGSYTFTFNDSTLAYACTAD